jgi:hypothetical protein
MAFAVSSGYYPERSFRQYREADIPRVCIEGIRVSEELPGFENADLGVMLVMKRSRKFRTTVSRAGLEIDDEYARLARLCAETLFEHIHDEVIRVSGKPGKPLSQAAFGCQYLSRQLEEAAGRGTIDDEDMQELADSEPSIVIERVENVGGKPITNRKLVSPLELHGIQAFWTIESRSVDSLGLISLDLGRELSLNEFLIALAPDIKQLRYSPILPDAQWSRSAVRASHCPARIEFSREHQQTAIEWVLRKGPSETELDLRAIIPKKIFNQLVEMFNKDDRVRSRWRSGKFGFQFPLETAAISGDDEKIVGICSRMGAFLNPGSNLLRTWQTIRKAMVKLVETGSIDKLFTAATVANAFNQCFSRGEIHEGPNTWRQEIASFRAIVNQLEIKEDLPMDLRDLVSPTFIFDATSFWRKWNRAGDEEWE